MSWEMDCKNYNDCDNCEFHKKEIKKRDAEIDSWKKLYEEHLNDSVAGVQMILDIVGDNKKLRAEFAEKDAAIKRAVEYIEISDYGNSCPDEFYLEIADFIKKHGE